jgi:hypothetical protein
MFDQNQNFEEPEDLKEIDEPSEDLASESADFAEPTLAKTEEAVAPRGGNGKGSVARKMLEEYREEMALRKAIYDDLYGFDEEE